MKSRRPRIAILAIGTEVTTGEILNSNASWLAIKLDACGLEILFHMAIPDDEKTLIASLDFLRSQVSHVLTIGGLGPTTDDKTRTVLADWAGSPLRFDKPSWKRIEDRFRLTGQPAPESNRQQCYFPETAIIIENRHGSANAFQMVMSDLEITALPGPPRELQGIWNDHLETKFRQLGSSAERQTLHTWTCLGIPESKLAEIVEEVMSGSGLQLGYRASVPVVHVKVWSPAKPSKETQLYLDRLNEVLAGFCIARDGIDHLTACRNSLRSITGSGHEILLADTMTGGILGTKLLSICHPVHSTIGMKATPDVPIVEICVQTPLVHQSNNHCPELVIKKNGTEIRKTYPEFEIKPANDTEHLMRQRAILAERILIDLGNLLA